MPAKKTKDDTKKIKKSKVDKVVSAEVVEEDYSHERVGHYSNAHLLYKLRRIRDRSIDTVVVCADSGKWKGLGAAEQAFEMSMNNIERIEQKERSPQGGTAIRIEIPGFDPSQIKLSPAKDDGESQEPAK